MWSRRGLLLAAALLPAAARGEGALVVFAAASLRNALDEAAGIYAAPVRVGYGASNALARQIEQGAPADLFLSADTDWMDYLAARDLIRPGSRVDLLGNRLVLIAPADSTAAAKLEPGLDLRAALAGGRLALCDAAVPAGKYGRAALTALGAWDSVKDRLAPAENVRAALLFVARGEAPLGIVYATDAAAEPAVKVLAVFAEELHPKIIYPAAILRASTRPDAPDLLAFLRGSAARAAFERHGFAVPGRT